MNMPFCCQKPAVGCIICENLFWDSHHFTKSHFLLPYVKITFGESASVLIAVVHQRGFIWMQTHIFFTLSSQRQTMFAFDFRPPFFPHCYCSSKTSPVFIWFQIHLFFSLFGYDGGLEMGVPLSDLFSRPLWWPHYCLLHNRYPESAISWTVKWLTACSTPCHIYRRGGMPFRKTCSRESSAWRQWF